MEGNLAKILEKSKVKAEYDPLEYLKEQPKYGK